MRSGELFVTPTVTDHHLVQAYLQMEKEGTLETVFFQCVPTISQFLAMHLNQGERIVLGAFRGAEDKPEFCGMGWVMNPLRMNGYHKAETGMVFFRERVGAESVSFGRLMLESFFSQYEIDYIFGVTPAQNKLALRYASKLGFSLHGPIPNFATWKGMPADAWISHMSAAQWAQIRRDYGFGLEQAA